MTTHILILKQLETITSLYQQGYCSDFIEKSLAKIIDLELHYANEQATSLRQKILVYEEQYHMKSDQFYEQFMAGTLGDEIDFIEWSVFYEMWQSVQKRIQILQHSN